MKNNISFLTKNRGILIFFAVMLLMPFLVGLIEGSSPSTIWSNRAASPNSLRALGLRYSSWRFLRLAMTSCSALPVCFPLVMPCFSLSRRISQGSLSKP